MKASTSAIRRSAKTLLLCGLAFCGPLATSICLGQEANELPEPPAQASDELPPASRSVLVPPAVLPTPPALTPPASSSDETHAPSGASVRRPAYLGLIGELEDTGIRVLSAHEGGPAALAGFRENDVITAVDGRQVTSYEDMTKVISNRFAGDELTFNVRRGDRTIELKVSLGARLEEGESANAAPVGAIDEPVGDPTLVAPEAAGRPRMGIHVATVTDHLRSDYGVAFRDGALITAVQAGSPADRAGLPAGGVIYAIDGNPVAREEDVVSHIAASRWGEEIELAYRYNDADFRKSVLLAPPAASASGAASDAGETRVETGRPLTLRRRVVVPGAFVPNGPGFGRIQRMIQAYGGPYIRFAPEVYVEESPVLEERAIEERVIEAPPTNSRSSASQEELNRLRQRVSELEGELAAEKAATP